MSSEAGSNIRNGTTSPSTVATESAIAGVSAKSIKNGVLQNPQSKFSKAVEQYVASVQAAEQRIKLANTEAESVGLTRNQILGPAGAAMLQQANNAPQSVLGLLASE